MLTFSKCTQEAKELFASSKMPNAENDLEVSNRYLFLAFIYSLWPFVDRFIYVKIVLYLCLVLYWVD